MGIAVSAVVGIQIGLALLTVATLAVAALGIVHPVVGVLALTSVCVLDPLAADFLNDPLSGNPLGTVTGGLWRYNTIGYVLTAAAFAGLPQLRPTLAWGPMRLGAMHVGVLFLGLLFSLDLVIGYQLTLDSVAYFGLLAYFLRIADDRDAWYWVGIVGGVLAAMAMPLYFLARSGLPFTNPNVVVFVPIMGVFAAWLGSAANANDGRRQMLLGALAATNLLWAFLSTSRGGLLTAAACGVFMLLDIRSARRRFVLAAVGVMIGLAATALFTPLQESATERFRLLFDSSASTRNRTSGRSELIVGGLEIFFKNPLGVGTGSFETKWAELGSVAGQREFIRAGRKFSPHAGWLRVLAENGVLGILVLFSFIGSFTWLGLGRTRNTGRLVGFSISLAISIALISTEFHMKALYFLAAGGTVLLHGLLRTGLPVEARRARRRPTLTVEPTPMEVH
jgi:O-antigen ligase